MIIERWIDVVIMLYNVLTKIQPEYHVGSTSCARWAGCHKSYRRLLKENYGGRRWFTHAAKIIRKVFPFKQADSHDTNDIDTYYCDSNPINASIKIDCFILM